MRPAAAGRNSGSGNDVALRRSWLKPRKIELLLCTSAPVIALDDVKIGHNGSAGRNGQNKQVNAGVLDMGGSNKAMTQDLISRVLPI
jgi:hypothetical protein